MRTQQEITSNKKLRVIQTGIDGGCGKIYLNGIAAKPAGVVWSWGGGWEHVSVSYPNRCPTWDEMCKVKEMFWHDSEVVVQFHPRKEDYVNIHPFCLHLWRKVGQDFETPPKIYV